MSPNNNYISTPSNLYQEYIVNIVVYCAVNGYPTPTKIVNIPPPEKIGEMYTIIFISGSSILVQHESFDLDPSTYRSTMDRKNPDSPSIDASPGKDKLFVTTHEGHLHPLCTGQWYFTYT